MTASTLCKFGATISCLILSWMGALGLTMEEPTTATVTVQLSVPQGETLPSGIPVVVTTENAKASFQLDAAGVGSTSIAVGTETRWLDVRFDVDRKSSNGVLITESGDALGAAKKKFAFPFGTEMRYDPSKVKYTWNVQADLAATITGTVKSSVGPIPDVMIGADGDLGFVLSKASGEFELKSLARGKANLVYFTGSRDGVTETHPREFVVPTESPSVNVGEVILSPARLVGKGSITLTVLGPVPAGATEDVSRSGVSLITPDGTRVYWAKSDSEGRVGRNPGPNGPVVPLPAGKLYVVPGLAGKAGSVTKAIKLLQAGKAADLDAAGVPSVVVQDGATVSLSIDPYDVASRIRGIK